jgi:hypothetical protein
MRRLSILGWDGVVGWNTVSGLERPIENVSTGRVKGCVEYRNWN